MHTTRKPYTTPKLSWNWRGPDAETMQVLVTRGNIRQQENYERSRDPWERRAFRVGFAVGELAAGLMLAARDAYRAVRAAWAWMYGS